MVETSGHRAFDISALLTFAFAQSERPQLLPDQPSEASTTASAGPNEEQEQPKQEVEHPAAEDFDHDERVDLTRYGPPDVLTRLCPTWGSQDVGLLVVEVVQASVSNVRAQLDPEAELRRRLVEGGSSEHVNKGKGAALSPSEPDAVSEGGDDESSRASSDEHLTPRSAQLEAGFGSEKIVVENRDVILASTSRPQLGPKSMSTPTLYPRRRELLKNLFQKTNEHDIRPPLLSRKTIVADTRERLVRRSSSMITRMDLKEKLRHAKERLHHKRAIHTACVFLFRPLWFLVIALTTNPTRTHCVCLDHLLTTTVNASPASMILPTKILSTCAATVIAKPASGVSSPIQSRPKLNGHRSVASTLSVTKSAPNIFPGP